MSQAGNTGMIMQQRFGDQNQIDSQNQQQLANMLLRNALSAPKTPELSWTQGLARMLEAGVSAHKQSQLTAKNEQIQQQQGNDAKILGAALASGDPRQVAVAMQKMQNPQSQSMALNVLSNMGGAQQAQNFNLQTKGVEQRFNKENKGIDYVADINKERHKGNIQSDLSSQNAQQEVIKKGAEIQGESGRDVNKIHAETAGKLEENAKARTQNRMLDLNSVINDPNAPQPIKDLAAKELTSLGPLNAQMAHPQGVANTNTSMMTGNGIAGTPGAAGGSGKGGAGAPPDIQSLATKARDNNAQINNVLRNIQTGVLNDQNTSETGRQAVHLAATAGVPGAAQSEAAIKEYEQVSAQAGLGGLKDFISGTGGSRMPKTLIDMVQQATMDKNDNVSAASPKLFLQKQINDRLIGLGPIEQEWINKNGGINIPDKTTGYNWEQANNAYMTQNPIVTKDDYEKNIQNKMGSADQSQQAAPKDVVPPQQGNPAPQAQAPDNSQSLPAPQKTGQQYPDTPPPALPPPPSSPQPEAPQNISAPPQDNAQSLPPPQGSMPISTPPMDQQQMLAMALANKQQNPQVPDYSNQFANSPNMSF